MGSTREESERDNTEYYDGIAGFQQGAKGDSLAESSGIGFYWAICFLTGVIIRSFMPVILIRLCRL